MFKLHVVQAQFGDGLVLSFGSRAKPRHILVDGGPSGNYTADLEPALGEIVGQGGKIDLVVLSHVDNDHLIGVLDLFAAVEDDEISGRKPRVRIGGLWHNSFERSIDPTGEVSRQMQAVMMVAGAASVTMPMAADAFYGIREGNRLRLMARKLKIPTNKGFKDDLLLVETAKLPIKFGLLEMRIAGPSTANLAALRNEWLNWLEETAQNAASNPAAAAMADKSVPNLSSIVLLARCDGKTILLTGDARGDHIIEGLKTAKLAKNGKLHVDVLKVQHHGSDRNTTRGFFDAITADTYVVSANGRYGNPDFDTLRWIVEGARDRHRTITFVVTNETDATKELRKKLPPSSASDYTLTILPPGQHSIEITLNA
jgi:beta-lactamase superfamily II metal-dependent hydrolase